MTTLSPPPSSTSTSDSSNVRPIACLRCRNRRSYCSKERPRCSRCRDGDFECVYEPSRKIPVNESYLRNLEAKAKAYEALLRRQRKRGSGYSVEARDSPDEQDEEFEDDHVLLGPFTQLGIDKPSTSFKGPGSSDNFLRSVRRLSGIYADDGSLDLNTFFYDPDALPSRRARTVDCIRLPPRDVAYRLLAAQHTYIGTIFAFTDPSTLNEELSLAYQGAPGPEDRESCLIYAKILILLAFGQLYSVNQWIDAKGPPGFGYFAHALRFLPDLHEEGSMLSAETLALAGYFMQNMNRRDAAFLYVGMALRMAISLGLHQEVASLPHTRVLSSTHVLEEAARERRRRTWWSIYSLDRIISVKSGNPLTIQDEDIGVRLPSRLPTEEACGQAVVVRHYTELSRTLSDIMKTVYSKGNDAPKSGKRLMASVQSIIQALSNWNRDLPDELRFHPAKLSISRESVSVFAHYYQCINMVARPLFQHVVQKRLKEIRTNAQAKEREWKENLSETTIRIIEMCVSAAQDTISMFTVAAERDLVATYGYMDTEHIFSAGIVLVMVCITFPTSEANTIAMKTGLDLLRNLAQRGNSHIAARYELLENLRSLVAPELAMSSLPAQNLTSFPTTLATSATAALQSPLTSELVAAQAAMPTFHFTSPVAAASLGDTVEAGAEPRSADTSLITEAVGPFPVTEENQMPSQPFQESINNGLDFMLWEEGFANAGFDASYDIAQWTQEAQTDMDFDESIGR